jgi:xanthine dehydrogenase/oxidase
MGISGYWEAVLIHICAPDGTVMLTHGGTEVGQGINTKVMQAVAKELAIPMDLIVTTTCSTEKVPNFTLTGGSGTSETVCRAAIDACQQLNARLQPVKDANPGVEWAELIAIANNLQVNLSVTGHTPPPITTDIFSYYVWCASFSEVEIDVLTGEIEILRTDIVYDGGQSLNPLIDIGQIEGAFVQGIGFFITEDAIINKEGRLVNNGTWDYKPPGSKDIPISFNVTFLKDVPNDAKDNVLGSKASGEPPFMTSCSVYFAVKDAIAAARREVGATGAFPLPVPATTVDIQQACLVSVDQLHI